MKSKGREPFRMGDTLVKAGETTRVHLPIADHFGIEAKTEADAIG